MSIMLITEKDIYNYKVYVSIQKFVQEILFNVAKDLYYNHHDSKLGTLSLIELWNCLENKRIKKKEQDQKKIKKKSKYSPEKRSCPLRKDIYDFKFNYEEIYLDVSNCNSIISMLKPESESNILNAETIIFENVKNIKNIRNEFYKFNWEKPKLEEFKDKLICEIKSICENMIKLYEDSNEIAIRYKNLGEICIRGINEFWDAKITSDDPNFIELLNNTKTDKYRQFVCECQKHLIDTYKKWMESSPLLEDKFKFNIDTVFVQPLLKLKDKDNYIPYKEILSKKLPNQGEPQIVIISADAGHGKTTICKKLTLEWCNLMKNDLSDFEYNLLLFIEVKRTTPNGIHQYLKEILLTNPLLKVKANQEEIILFLQQLKLLIIVDACDEKLEEAQCLINDLLDFHSDKKIVITTRPHHMRQIIGILQNKGLLYLDLDLEGFENEKEYIEKVWNHLQKEDKTFTKNMNNFLDFISGLPEDFKNLLKVPLIAFLLIFLWVNSKKEIKNLTFTSLYCQILDLQEETIKKKLLQNIDENLNSNEITNIIKNFFKIFSEKCYKLLNGKKGMNSDCVEEMKLYLESELKKPDYVDIVLSTIFISTRNFKNLNLFQYEFLHKTQFEFFVAYYVANRLTEYDGLHTLNDLEIFNENNFKDNIGEFSFLLGILNENKQLKTSVVGNIIELIKRNNIYDINIFWKLLSQTMSDHSKNELPSDFRPNEELCKYFGKLLKTSWRLLDKTVLSGLRILCYVNFNLEMIDIDLFINPYKIPSFESTFFKMIQSLSKCRGNIKPSLQLKLSNHTDKFHEINEENTSDRILTCLKPNCSLNLKIFKGHIKTIEAVNVLDTFMELEKLFIKVASIEVLKQLIAVCSNMKKKLNEFTLIFDKPYDKTKIRHLPTLNIKNTRRKVDICIIYHTVEDINLMIENLTKMKDTPFSHVKLEIDESSSPKKWLLKIHSKKLTRKLSVKSRYKMPIEEKDEIQDLIDYTLEWIE